LRWLRVLCGILFAAIWIEKGMGLIVPGFIPSPLHEIVEYAPSWVEISVTLGIWALGMFVLTALVKIGIAVELGTRRLSMGADAA
jgi:molybdopterin-containing oxidoreductase family membrane subunit